LRQKLRYARDAAGSTQFINACASFGEHSLSSSRPGARV